jgi:hypothetical protein
MNFHKAVFRLGFPPRSEPKRQRLQPIEFISA